MPLAGQRSAPQAAAPAIAERARLGATAEGGIPAPPRIEIVSPDASIRWRIGPRASWSIRGRRRDVGSDAHRSGNRTRWLAHRRPGRCAGSSTRGNRVAGRDGRQWQRLMFLLAVDLPPSSRDTRVATVTAMDGRRFTTVDGERLEVILEPPSHVPNSIRILPPPRARFPAARSKDSHPVRFYRNPRVATSKEPLCSVSFHASRGVSLASAASTHDRTGPTVSAQTSAAQIRRRSMIRPEPRSRSTTRHRACSGPAQPQASAGHATPPVHGHRRDGQSGHGALQVAF